jgi:hypothetical protein
LLVENFDHAAADDAAAEERDADGFCHAMENLEQARENPKRGVEKSSAKGQATM